MEARNIGGWVSLVPASAAETKGDQSGLDGSAHRRELTHAPHYLPFDMIMEKTLLSLIDTVPIARDSTKFSSIGLIV